MTAFAPVPDFNTLAQQQANLSNAAGTATTQANRANQTNPYGSLTWSQNPDGSWTQNIQTNDMYSNLNNALTAGQQNLAIGLGRGVSGDGLSDWGGTDITQGVSQMPDGSFGASQQVIDAMKGLQQPGLDAARDAERTRLAAMGITLGSDASNTSEYNLGRTQNDADLKAILAGTQEYGNVFNRQLAQRQQGIDENIKRSNLMTALRGSQMNERLGGYQANLAGFNALGSGRVDPKFASYAGATPTVAPNVYGAAQDTFNANQAQANAANAASANRTAGNTALAGAGLGMLGGIKGVTGLVGSAWNGISNLFGGGATGSDSWFGNLGSGDSFDYLANQGQGGGDVLGDFGSDMGWW